jgi:DNA-binding MarR family transcriptional regulator
MSAELQSTLTEFALWLYRGFFLPGDRLSSASPGSLLSGVVSTAIWLSAIVAIIVVCRAIRDLDQALTAFIVRMYEEVRRALRVVARRLGIAIRSYAHQRQARLTRTEVSELPALTPLQIEVLRTHAGLPAGHLLTPSDVASALDMRLADVERTLGGLKKLSLVERSFGAGDGEDGYRLTRPGEVLLAACSQERSGRIEPTLGSI